MILEVTIVAVAVFGPVSVARATKPVPPTRKEPGTWGSSRIVDRGSDLWFYRGQQEHVHGSRTGHEPMGVVEEVGAAVRHVVDGTDFGVDEGDRQRASRRIDVPGVEPGLVAITGEASEVAEESDGQGSSIDPGRVAGDVEGLLHPVEVVGPAVGLDEDAASSDGRADLG